LMLTMFMILDASSPYHRPRIAAIIETYDSGRAVGSNGHVQERDEIDAAL
jgi:hypothetical protein